VTILKAAARALPAFLVLLIAGVQPARAQGAIEVHVRTAGGPAASAGVTVVSLPDTTRVRRFAPADSLGVARISGLPAGRYRVDAALIGYEAGTRSIRVNDNATARADILLREAAISLPGIVIEGNRRRTRFEENAGATVTELTQKDVKAIPALGESDVLRAIDVLPGVVSTSDFSSAFNVRGGSADENLILLDGLPIYNPFHLGGLFSVFNTDMVKRVELLSGGFPAQYGGRVSSVLTVESEAGPDSAGFDLQSGVSIIATRVAIGANIPKKALSWGGLTRGRARISVRRSYFDQILKPIFDFPYHLTDVQLFADASTPRGARVTISGYTGHDVLDLAGLDSFPLKLRWHWGNNVIGGTWSVPLGGNRTIETRAGYSQFRTDIRFPDFDDTEFSSVIEQTLLRTELSGRHRAMTWRFGASADHIDYHNLARTGGTVFGENEDRGTLIGGFAQQSTRTGRWLLETGLRADSWMPRATGAMSSLQPRVALKRFIGDGDNFALKLAVGRYTQFAHSLRDEELPLGIDVWVLSGDRAPVVESDQIQGGIEGFVQRRWYFAAESYYRRFNGVVANNTAENPDVPSDDLLRGTGVSYGADFQLRRDEGRVRPMLAVSWLKATRTYDDIGTDPASPPKLEYPPVFDRRLDIDLVIQAMLPHRWELGVRWNLGTGLPYTRPLGGYKFQDYSLLTSRFHPLSSGDTTDSVILGERNGERYPVYHRLDAGIHRTFVRHWGTLTPTLDLLNVYNRKNVLFYFFDYSVAQPTRAGVSMFPLLPTFGLEIRF
jgi:hypothetical protein